MYALQHRLLINREVKLGNESRSQIQSFLKAIMIQQQVRLLGDKHAPARGCSCTELPEDDEASEDML